MYSNRYSNSFEAFLFSEKDSIERNHEECDSSTKIWNNEVYRYISRDHYSLFSDATDEDDNNTQSYPESQSSCILDELH